MVQFFFVLCSCGNKTSVKLVPSNIGLVRGPLKAERRVRFPQEPLAEKLAFKASFFFMTQVFEYRFSGGALNP